MAQDFRILLLIGDDFGDFVAGARVTLAGARALDEANAAMWGVKWIALAESDVRVVEDGGGAVASRFERPEPQRRRAWGAIAPHALSFRTGRVF